MQDFLTFTTSLMQSVSSFLMSDPIVWFVGIFLVLAVTKLVFQIINIR